VVLDQHIHLLQYLLILTPTQNGVLDTQLLMHQLVDQVLLLIPTIMPTALQSLYPLRQAKLAINLMAGAMVQPRLLPMQQPMCLHQHKQLQVLSP
jgi:hypothetical protein